MLGNEMKNTILAASGNNGYEKVYLEVDNFNAFFTNPIIVILLIIIGLASIFVAIKFRQPFAMLGAVALALCGYVAYDITSLSQLAGKQDALNITQSREWAKERYGIDLTEEQTKKLWDNKPVIIKGNELDLVEDDIVDDIYYIAVSKYAQTPPDNELKNSDIAEDETENW
jgi:hypothetical protein